MKDPDKNITVLEDMMEKLYLTQPISSNVKKYIESSEKEQYKKILKIVGQWGIVSAIITEIYYFFKKFGLSFTANKFISFILISVVGTASYLSIKYILNQMAEEEQKSNQKIKIIEKKVIPDSQIKLKRKNPPLSPFNERGRKGGLIKNNKIEIRNFTSASVDDQLLNQFTKSLIKSFGKISKNRVASSNIATSKYTKHIVLGNIEDMGEYKKIFIKVIDTGTSEIIYTTFKEIDGKENLDLVSKKIAIEILRKIKKWKR